MLVNPYLNTPPTKLRRILPQAKGSDAALIEKALEAYSCRPKVSGFEVQTKSRSEIVADRYLIKMAVHDNLRQTFPNKIAAKRDVGQVVIALLETSYEISGQRVVLASLSRRVKQIFKMVKKTPSFLGDLKSALGVQSLKDIPKAFKALAKVGFKHLKKLFGYISQKFPLSLYFVPAGKMPGLTSVMADILENSFLAPHLQKIKGKAVKVDALLNKHLPTLKRPILAAIFIFVWLNVSELTWDFKDLAIGFTGGLSFDQLLATFPESGVGLVAAMFGLGYMALPATLIFRLLWLVRNNYIEYSKGGLVILWDIMGVEGRQNQFYGLA
jgi:hypothetical protein